MAIVHVDKPIGLSFVMWSGIFPRLESLDFVTGDLAINFSLESAWRSLRTGSGCAFLCGSFNFSKLLIIIQSLAQMIQGNFSSHSRIICVLHFHFYACVQLLLYNIHINLIFVCQVLDGGGGFVQELMNFHNCCLVYGIIYWTLDTR